MSHPKNDPNAPKSWFNRLSDVFLTEPKNIDELSLTIQDAAQNHIIDGQSLQMIEGVINISQMHVRDIMIPKTQIVLIEEDQSLQTCLPIITQSSHSRFPVIGDNEEVLGIILAKDVLKLFSNQPELDASAPMCRSLMRPAIFVPESKRLDAMLSEFKSSKNHLAIVVDEYGSLSGVVTIEDVLEQIVGSIEDEFDVTEAPLIVPTDKHTFTVQALTLIDDFNEFFDINLEDETVDTIGGIISKKLGRIPQKGDSIIIDTLNFKVICADDRHLHTLEVTRHDDSS